MADHCLYGATRGGRRPVHPQKIRYPLCSVIDTGTRREERKQQSFLPSSKRDLLAVHYHLEWSKQSKFHKPEASRGDSNVH
jgi:hypothetical protein